MAGATAAVVVLAARAGLETHRATIEVMHMLGSTDVQVARLFQRRIALDAAFGGVVGGAARARGARVIGERLAALGIGTARRRHARRGATGCCSRCCRSAFVVLATLAARVTIVARAEADAVIVRLFGVAGARLGARASPCSC